MSKREEIFQALKSEFTRQTEEDYGNYFAPWCHSGEDGSDGDYTLDGHFDLNKLVDVLVDLIKPEMPPYLKEDSDELEWKQTYHEATKLYEVSVIYLNLGTAGWAANESESEARSMALLRLNYKIDYLTKLARLRDQYNR